MPQKSNLAKLLNQQKKLEQNINKVQPKQRWNNSAEKLKGNNFKYQPVRNIDGNEPFYKQYFEKLEKQSFSRTSYDKYCIDNQDSSNLE